MAIEIEQRRAQETGPAAQQVEEVGLKNTPDKQPGNLQGVNAPPPSEVGLNNSSPDSPTLGPKAPPQRTGQPLEREAPPDERLPSVKVPPRRGMPTRAEPAEPTLPAGPPMHDQNPTLSAAEQVEAKPTNETAAHGSTLQVPAKANRRPKAAGQQASAATEVATDVMEQDTSPQSAPPETHRNSQALQVDPALPGQEVTDVPFEFGEETPNGTETGGVEILPAADTGKTNREEHIDTTLSPLKRPQDLLGDDISEDMQTRIKEAEMAYPDRTVVLVPDSQIYSDSKGNLADKRTEDSFIPAKVQNELVLFRSDLTTTDPEIRQAVINGVAGNETHSMYDGVVFTATEIDGVSGETPASIVLFDGAYEITSPVKNLVGTEKKQEGIERNEEWMARNIEYSKTASFRNMGLALLNDITEGVTSNEFREVDRKGSEGYGNNLSLAPLAKCVAEVELKRLGMQDKIKLILENEEPAPPDEEAKKVVVGYTWINTVTVVHETHSLTTQLEETIRRAQEARHSLATENIRLIFRYVRKYFGNLEYHDLIQEASDGLTIAASSFDWRRGVAFATFAGPSIEGRIKNAIRDKSNGIRIPRPVQENKGKIRLAEKTLREKGIDINVQTLARESDIVADEVVDILRKLPQATHISSLSEPIKNINNEIEGTLGDIIPSDSDVAKIVTDNIVIQNWIKTLPIREQIIIFRTIFQGRKQRQVGQEIGISQMHVCRIIKIALLDLRDQLAPEILEDESNEIQDFVNLLPSNGDPTTNDYNASDLSPYEETFAQKLANIGINNKCIQFAINRYLLKMSPLEIAQKQNISLGTVFQQLKDFHKQIEKYKSEHANSNDQETE